MHRLLTPLVHLVVPLAAFLTFMFQPVVGKLLLPVYGGSAGTWLTVAMFFQGALLAGYFLAWRGLEKYRAALPKIIAILAVIAPFSLRLPPWHFPGLPEWPGVLAALTLSIFPTVLLTTSAGIVLQGWCQERRGRTPFYLYAVSNIGSALALLAYPFAIEPAIGLGAQILTLKILLGTLSVALLILCWLQKDRSPATAAVTGALGEPETISNNTVAAWFLLSAATCTLMLGAIPVLGAEFGSNPLTWLLPLGVYLISFSVAFSGWWRPSFNYLALVALGGGLFGYMQSKGIGPAFLSNSARLWLGVVVLSGCLGGQGFLYALRPEKRSSFFYLVIAAGGLAAGLFVSAIAPFVFDRNVEFVAAAFTLVVFLALQLLARADALARYSLVLLIIIPVCWIGMQQLSQEPDARTTTTHHRNPYGTLVLREQEDIVRLSNESALHGAQLVDKKFNRAPTTYYTVGSAAGVVLSALRKQPTPLRVAAIGLGTGTLAAYGRKGDRYVFWDINPLVIRLAQEKFSFIRDCPADVDVILADGRLGLAASTEKFDVLVLDAFSGDSVPAHLLTREAFATYFAHLDQGIVLAHISNRYLDLFPVVATAARQAGWRCLFVHSTPQAAAKLALHANTNSYAVIYPPTREAEVSEWFEKSKSNPDFTIVVDHATTERSILWTDDRNAIMDLLTWRKLLRR